MKIILRSLCTCFLFSCLYGIFIIPAVGQSPESVILFNGRDGGGQQQPIPTGSYAVSGKQVAASGDKNAGISVRVPKDHMVRFCEDKGSGDGGGNCEEFSEGTHNILSLGFNFIKVWRPTTRPAPPPLTVFEQLNWGGRAQGFGPGMFRSFRGEFGKINDNQAMSIIIGKGFEARFCSDEGTLYRGAGDCEVHGEGRHNLRFANSISFIEVKDLSDKSPEDSKMPVVLYEDGSQAGIMQGFDVGEFAASAGQFAKIGNDRASSIVVKDGYRATVCADEGGERGTAGSCEEFGPGKRNIRNKKAASYLKVSKAGQ